MLSFNWKNKYSVGIRDLDQQHQAILDGLSELHEAMMNGKIEEIVVPMVTKLTSLTVEHFVLEEQLMNITQFPGLVNHRASHQELSKRVREFMTRHEMGDRAAYCQFMYVLRDWITKHMAKEDQEYAPWLAKHGIR